MAESVVGSTQSAASMVHVQKNDNPDKELRSDELNSDESNYKAYEMQEMKRDREDVPAYFEACRRKMGLKVHHSDMSPAAPRRK